MKKKAVSLVLVLVVLLTCYAPFASAASYPVPGRTLQYKMRGNDVKWVQQQLNEYHSLYGLTVDGDFGNSTRAAVLNFQKNMNLEADGIVGPATLAQLKRVRVYRWLGSDRIRYWSRRDPRYFAYNILINKNISLAKTHTKYIDNAFAFNTMIDMAYKGYADLSEYSDKDGTALGGTVRLNANLLHLILRLQKRYGTLTISETCGGAHCKGSDHYKGKAIDVTYCGGGVSRAKGKEIYSFLRSEGFNVKCFSGNTVFENSSHYHIAIA